MTTGDVRAAAVPCLSHRVVPSTAREAMDALEGDRWDRVFGSGATEARLLRGDGSGAARAVHTREFG